MKHSLRAPPRRMVGHKPTTLPTLRGFMDRGMRVRLTLATIIVIAVAAIALVGSNTGRAQPRNMTYVCVPDGLNCMEVDEEASPSQDPQFVVRVDTNDSRNPRWVFVGSACPGPTRTDIVAYSAVQGTRPENWHAIQEEKGIAFVFQSDTPSKVKVTYGRLDVPGGTITADSSERTINGATWRCISRRNPNVPLPPEPGSSSSAQLLSIEQVNSWCLYCDFAKFSIVAEENGNAVHYEDPGRCLAIFTIPPGVNYQAFANGVKYDQTQPARLINTCAGTFRLAP